MKKESIDLFKELYLEHKDNLLGIAILYLKDYHLAQDAVQETFFKVFEKLSTLDTVINKTAWITTITVNICKNKLKRKYRSEISSSELDLDSLPVLSESLDEKLTVLEALHSLPLTLKEVVVLYYYQELTQREIAEILKVSESTVAYRLKTARKLLKNYLKEDNDYE